MCTIGADNSIYTFIHDLPVTNMIIKWSISFVGESSISEFELKLQAQKTDEGEASTTNELREWLQ